MEGRFQYPPGWEIGWNTVEKREMRSAKEGITAEGFDSSHFTELLETTGKEDRRRLNLSEGKDIAEDKSEGGRPGIS